MEENRLQSCFKGVNLTVTNWRRIAFSHVLRELMGLSPSGVESPSANADFNGFMRTVSLSQ